MGKRGTLSLVMEIFLFNILTTFDTLLRESAEKLLWQHMY